jgi:two-component system OmpR family response regulator
MIKFSVLLVDDEEDFLTLLAERLGSRQIDVRKVSTGAEALAELSQRFADLVLLDARMPGMDGLETLQRIKRDHPDVQVVMLTGFVDSSLAIHAHQLGADDYLTKPVNMPELLDKIDEAFTRSMSRRHAR